ncbi:MAG TPA: hypothetical protein VEA44_16085 [Caulobacter sp.]|nr:hypothetical protein [Caulobacter sp.]
MTRPLTMAETAEEVGLSVERFRKVWRDWVKAYAFPAPEVRPARNPSRARHQWDPAEVAAWRAGRKRALGRREAAPSAANDESIPAAIAHRVAAERQRLAANMARSG